MNTHQIVVSYRNEGGTITISTQVILCDLSVNLEIPIPRESVELEFNLKMPLQGLLSFGMGCKKLVTVPPQASGLTAMVEIRTNDPDTPDDTFVLTPENGLWWNVFDAQPCPFTAAVNKFFVTAVGTGDSELFMRFALSALDVPA